MTMLEDDKKERTPLLMPNVKAMHWAPLQNEDMHLALFSLNRSTNDASELVIMRLPSRDAA